MDATLAKLFKPAAATPPVRPVLVPAAPAPRSELQQIFARLVQAPQQPATR